MQQIFHWCSLFLYLCWPARFSSPRSLKSLINVPKVSSSHLLMLKTNKKASLKSKIQQRFTISKHNCQPKSCRWQHNSGKCSETAVTFAEHLWSQPAAENSPVSESLHRDRAERTGDSLISSCQHTLQHDFQSFVLPEIAMIVAANTRHGNIPVIRVSGFRIENFHIFVFGPNFCLSLKVETENFHIFRF